jgi:hypothetical protein
MRVLIVATNTTPPGLSDEVRAGRHQRVDYLELAQRFGTMYHDYNALRSLVCCDGSRIFLVSTSIRRWQWRAWRNVAATMWW